MESEEAQQLSTSRARSASVQPLHRRSGDAQPDDDDDDAEQQEEQDEPLSQQQMLLAHRYSTRPAGQSGAGSSGRAGSGDAEEDEEDEVLVDAPSAVQDDDEDGSSDDSDDYRPVSAQPPKVERTQSDDAEDAVSLTTRQKRKREVDSEAHQTAIASIRARRGQREPQPQPDAAHVGLAASSPPRPAASRADGKPGSVSSLAASFASLSSPSISALQPPHRHGWEVSVDMLASELFVVDDAADAGMQLPPGLDLHKLSELMGPEREAPVRVTDASTQRAMSGWTLRRWEEYWTEAAGERGEVGQRQQAVATPVYELQLQLSAQAVLDAVKRPAVVEDVDRLTALWRETQELRQAASASSSAFPACVPSVQLHCIASAAGAWQDFSLPLAGCGSWHHVVSGSRTFLLLRSDSTTLRLYEEWHAKRLQQSTPLLHFIASHPAYEASVASSPAPPLCRSVTLTAGQTLFLPPGQLRACLSPSASLLLCGHYWLTSAGATVVQVDAMGRRCPATRCRFPWLRFVLWLLAGRERERLTVLDEHEVEGLGAIAGALAVACREKRDAAAVRQHDGQGGAGEGNEEEEEEEEEEAVFIPYGNGEALVHELMLRLRLLTLQRERQKAEEAKRAREERGRRSSRKDREELEEAERGWQRTAAYMDRLQLELKRCDDVRHDYRPLSKEVQQSTWLLDAEDEKEEGQDAMQATDSAIAGRHELREVAAPPGYMRVEAAQEDEEPEEEGEADAAAAATSGGNGRRKRLLEDDDDWQAEDEPEAADDDDDAWDVKDDEGGERQAARSARRGKPPSSKKSRAPTKTKGGAAAKGRAGASRAVQRQRPAAAAAAAAASAPPVSVAAKLSATLLSGLGGVGGVSSGSKYGKYALPGQGRSSQLMNMRKMRRSIKAARQQDSNK